MTTGRWLLLGGVLYVVMIAIITATLFDARRRMTKVYGAPQEQAHWEDFNTAMQARHRDREILREELSRHSGQPVRAAPPKNRSARPPTLELLENHFAACLIVCVAGISALFILVWGLLMGAMLRPGRAYEDSPECDSTTVAGN